MADILQPVGGGEQRSKTITKITERYTELSTWGRESKG